MVNLGIPKNYTASPSSVTATPSLTVNHEATLGLDSSNSFEGPEKLLEVWFSPSADALPIENAKGLKAVDAEIWKSMLDLVNCKVLSIIESEDVDAYLLSESSMFVFPNKLILKTCGTTTLLAGLPRILEIAVLFGGFCNSASTSACSPIIAAAPYRVFYSRKNFLFPDRQHGPHRSWRDEVKTLDRLFLSGSAYMIGKMNGEHWYLYLTEPNTLLTPPASPVDEEQGTQTRTLSLPTSTHKTLQGAEDGDETLEILMTDLERENAQKFHLDHASAVAESQYHHMRASEVDHIDVFGQLASDETNGMEETQPYPEELTTEGHALGTVVAQTCGLADVYPKSKYPNSRIDAYMFNPCGFSANGVVPAPDPDKGTHYFTVHVTPEPHCSFASFETNVPATQKNGETVDIVSQVVNIFKPGRFTVTLFEAKPIINEDSIAEPNLAHGHTLLGRQAARRNPKIDNIFGYRRIDRIVHDLDGYDLVFRYYERNDWKGGEPRIGEPF